MNPQPTPERSKCCGARAYVSSGDEGANFYVCAKCERACDIRCEVMSDLATPQDPPLSGAEYLNAKDRDALLDSQKQIDALADIVGGEEYGDCRECKEGTEHSHCDVCKNKLSSCSCPQRQPDGSWVEPTPPPEQLDERNAECAFCRHIRMAHGIHGCSFYETCGCESFTPSTLVDTTTYVDSRTEEERANPPKTTLTTTVDMVGGEECGTCKKPRSGPGLQLCSDTFHSTPPSKQSEECRHHKIVLNEVYGMERVEQYWTCLDCKERVDPRNHESTPPKAEGAEGMTKEKLEKLLRLLWNPPKEDENLLHQTIDIITDYHNEALTSATRAVEERKDGEFRKMVESNFSLFNGYDISRDNKEAEAAHLGAELFKEELLSLLPPPPNEQTKTN